MNSSSYGRQFKKRKRFVILAAAAVVLILGTGIFFSARAVISAAGKRGGIERSRGWILNAWNKRDYDAILEGSRLSLEKRPLDPFYLTFAGFASFYKGIALSDGEEMLGLMERSVQLLRRALLRDSLPLRREAWYVLGKAYFMKGRFFRDLSAAYLEKARADGMLSGDMDEYLAAAYLDLERFPDSITAFERALAARKTDLLCIAAAQAYARAGKAEKAIELLGEAVRMTTDVETGNQARLELGSLYQNRREWASAEGQYLAILEKNPGSAEARYRLGLVYEAIGDPVKARSEWRKAVKIDPSHQAALMKLKRS